MREGTRIQQKTDSRTAVKGSASTEISKVSINVVAIFGVAVGVWSLACLIGGLASAGGPFALAASWVKAVTGM